jgi:hypothetical protein
MFSYEMSSQSGKLSVSAKKVRDSVPTRESSKVTMVQLGEQLCSDQSKTMHSPVETCASGLSSIKPKLRKPSCDDSTQVIFSKAEILHTDKCTLNGLSCGEVNFVKAPLSNQQVVNASDIELHLREIPHPSIAEVVRSRLAVGKKIKTNNCEQLQHLSEVKETPSHQIFQDHHQQSQDSDDPSESNSRNPLNELLTPSIKDLEEHSKQEGVHLEHNSDTGSDSDSDSSFSEYSVSDKRSCVPQYLFEDFLPHYLHRGENARKKHYWPFGESPEICIGSFCKLNGPDSLLEGRLFAEDLAFSQLKRILQVQTNLVENPHKQLLMYCYQSEGESPSLNSLVSKSTKPKVYIPSRSQSVGWAACKQY